MEGIISSSEALYIFYNYFNNSFLFNKSPNITLLIEDENGIRGVVRFKDQKVDLKLDYSLSSTCVNTC